MRVLIADFETDPFDFEKEDNYVLKERFVIFQDYSTKEFSYFILENNPQGYEDLKDFVKNCCSEKNPTRIYFHNLQFDINFFLQFIPKNAKYEIVKSKGRFMKLRVYKEYIRKSGKYEGRKYTKTMLDIRDSYVVLLASVDDIGRAMGLPKLEQDYFAKIDRKYIEYCKRDIEIITNALEQLCSMCNSLFGEFDVSIDILSLPLTVPALAKQIWIKIIKHKWGDEIINAVFDMFRGNYEEMLRQYYFGGRVEVFDFNECQNGAYNDYNSHYPAAMRDYLYPIAPYSFEQCLDSERCFLEFSENSLMFGAFCDVEEKEDIPVIPVRNKEGKILFPIGWKDAFLFREEIEYLLARGAKVRIKIIAKCSGWLPIFRDFVQILYTERMKRRKTFWEFLIKILMNALYGKFAEVLEKEDIKMIPLEEYQESDIVDEENSELIELNEMLFVLIRKTKTVSIKINLFFSMRITALCRMKLHQGTVTPGIKSKYCDTDSIVSDKIIEDSRELGHLKPEFIFARFQALGCKEYVYLRREQIVANLYLFSVKVKMKGFGALSYENFADFPENYFQPKRNWRVAGFFEVIKRKMKLGEVVVFNKQKISVYDKRWINEDFTTRPFHMQNDDFNEMKRNNLEKIVQIVQKYKRELRLRE